jgi:hypothetical protein
MEEKTAPQPRDDRPIEEAIALFEGILQTSPEDQVALEALSLAYEQTGNLPLARTTLIRLARAIIRKNAHEAASAVITRLKPLSENDFDALEALRSLETLVQGGADTADLPGAAPDKPARELLSGVALRRQVLRREMDLAWKLHEAGELNQEEYAAVVEDLTRLISHDQQTTLSLLHTLVDRAYPGIDRVMHYLAKTGKRPFLSLEAFDIQPVDLGDCPLDYLLHLGALPFAQMEGEPLIGLLSPLDKSLAADITAHVGRNCHFYLISAEAFDAGVKKITELGAPAAPKPEA